MSQQQDQPNDNETATREQQQRIKEYGRHDRLSFRTLAESQLRRELRDVSMEKCKDTISEFATCSQKEGLMVVFSCNHLFQKVNQCMRLHNSPEAWEKYRIEHADEIERKATLQKPMGSPVIKK